jgi:ribosomal protein S28E/S33
MSRYPEFDLHAIRTQSIHQRPSRVGVEQFAQPARAGASFAEFLECLPQTGATADIQTVAQRIIAARHKGRAVVVSCGGHLVKCGLSPVLVGLMEAGFVTALAVHGAVAIHDIEIALYGVTSEDVEAGLQTGSFGVAEEPAEFFNCTLARAQREELGAGEALGQALLKQNAPHADKSLLAACYRLRIPMTVHIALGTDIVHMHPSADGASYGETSLRDFRILTAAMEGLAGGGVLLNIGSAVILPEVLLKAMALLRNRRHDFKDFLGVDCDFIRQHRATQQLIHRVEALGGTGIALTGHHEILVPLLAFAVLEAAQTR